eukprot:CAMPEP_0114136032 /NCGR_PEP_ID=MMETSP0043_2-20121206/14996_1 /TAXON_ID=464988 /ORGANISM="Hemiselmis andersenii, Strain CCMP644" /LENGTH=278 /DNA_ID=CAMNT_0001229755 /DNA_START=168 /DNA_END=1000 /DNA_ORIENTATION=+
MEGLRIKTPPKHDTRQKSKKMLVMATLGGFKGFTSNPMETMKGMVASTKGGVKKEATLELESFDDHDAPAAARKASEPDAAADDGGWSGGGGAAGAATKASPEKDSEKEEHEEVEGDEDTSPGKKKKKKKGKEGKKGKEEVPDVLPPWAGGPGSLPYSDDESRPASVYDFGAGDRLLRPKLFLTHPPVIHDPVEDRVRSRGLGVLTITLIPVVLATLLLVGVWDSSSVVTTERTPMVSVLFRSGDPWVLDRPPRPGMAPKMLVTNTFGYPLKGVEVTA